MFGCWPMKCLERVWRRGWVCRYRGWKWWGCLAGRQLGSRYPGDPARLVVHDFLPDDSLREVENLSDFAGMLVYDKWTCNTNGRQVVFFTEPGRSRRQALMIDQGFCFNAGG